MRSFYINIIVDGPDSTIFRVLVLLLVYMCHKGSSDVRDGYQVFGVLVQVRTRSAENSLRNGKGGH